MQRVPSSGWLLVCVRSNTSNFGVGIRSTNSIIIIDDHKDPLIRLTNICTPPVYVMIDDYPLVVIILGPAMSPVHCVQDYKDSKGKVDCWVFVWTSLLIDNLDTPGEY